MLLFCVVLMLMASLVAAGCAAPSPAPAVPVPAKPGPIELTAISFSAVQASTSDMFREYIKRVNDQANGELIIKIVGGPEAIPQFDQFNAVTTGVVSMGMLSSTFHMKEIPEAGAFSFSNISIVEQRATGFYDFMVDVYKKANLFYLGRTRHDVGFYIYTNALIKDPKKDFKGLRFRTSPLFDEFFKTLGLSATTMPLGDIYTAMERGVINGFPTSSTMAVDSRWYEVTKYRIEHPFYSNDLVFLVNLDTWKRLPKHLQDLMMNIMIKTEPEVITYYDKESEVAKKKLREQKMEFVEFSAADAKWYLDAAYEAGWKGLMTKYPETGLKIKRLLTR